MLRLEAELPGFGGFFLDATGTVYVYLKKESPTSWTAVRARVHEAHAQRPDPIPAIMARAASATVLDGQYSLSELIAFEEVIRHSPSPIPGLEGLGPSLRLNRLKVGFRDQTTLQQGTAVILSLGIPRDALIAEVWGEAAATGTWRDRHRPTRGGVQIGIGNRSRWPLWTSPLGHQVELFNEGTYGYNVRASNGSEYAMVSAHVVNQFAAQNGAVGDTVFQPSGRGPVLIPNAVAVLSRNPPWTTNCHWPATGETFDYCTYADVALASVLPGVSVSKQVGWSEVGWNGQPGGSQIQEWIDIRGVVAPEYLGVPVYKSGTVTGTTIGLVDLPRVSRQVPAMAWGMPSPGYQTVSMLFLEHIRIAGIGWGYGDSGSPVFACFSYNPPKCYAVGMQATAEPATTNSVCAAGQQCTIYAARWDEIEMLHGFAGLSPSSTAGGGGGGGVGGDPPLCPIDQPGCAEQ